MQKRLDRLEHRLQRLEEARRLRLSQGEDRNAADGRTDREPEVLRLRIGKKPSPP